MRYKNCLKYLIFFIVAINFFTGCSYDDTGETQQNTDKKGGGFAIPFSIKAAAFPDDTTLIAKVYIDDVDRSSAPTKTQNFIFPITENMRIEMPGISVGNHSFTILFEYTNDPLYAGTFELIQATKLDVNINAGTNPDLEFFESDYDDSMFDRDSDGISNLIELGTDRTDPNDSKCILDFSLLDSCTLG